MTAPLSAFPTTGSGTPAPTSKGHHERVLPVSKAAFTSFQERSFQALRAPLIQLMEGSLAADLPAVLSAARRLSAQSDNDYPFERQLADYILFPLFRHLRSDDIRHLPQATQENVLELLWFVWQRIPTVPTLLQADAGGKAHQVPLVYDSVAMDSLMVVARTALAQSSEDIAHRSVAVLLLILGHPSVPDPFNPNSPHTNAQLVTDVKSRPERVLEKLNTSKSAHVTSLSQFFSARIGNLLFFQLVTSLVDLLASCQLLKLRQLVLVAIHDLLLVVAQDPNVVGLALPSIMSKCKLLVCEPNPNSAQVSLAFDVLSRLIPFAFQRTHSVDTKANPKVENVDPHESKDALALWHAFASKAGLSPSPPTFTRTFDLPTRSFPLSSVEFARTSGWFTTAATNVTAALDVMYNTLNPSTASPDVLVSACNLARTLTTYSSVHLVAAIPRLLKFAAACTLSDFTQVQSTAASVIDAVCSLPVQFQDIPSQALSEALGDLTSLASVSDDDKVTRLRQLQGCLVAFKSLPELPSTSALHTTFTTSMDKTIRAWQSLLIVDSETPLRSETDARFRRWNFVAFHQLPVADAAWNAIGAWASFGSDVVVQAVLSKLIESANLDKDFDGNPATQPTFVTKLSDDPLADLRNQLLAARFAAHTDKPDKAKQHAAQRTERRHALYALFAAVLAANPSSSWLLQHATSVLENSPVDPLPAALVLTGLEQSQLPSYTDFLRTHLALILVHSTSASHPLQVAAQAYIERTLVPQLQCSSLPELLDKFSPYVMHQVHLGLMYPQLEPGLPKMLLAVARAKAHANSVTGGWLQDLVKPVMEALAHNVQCEDMWREFTLALIEIVRQVQVDPLPLGKRQVLDHKKNDGGHVDTRASKWIQKAFGPAAVVAARAAKEAAEGVPPWERKRQPGEPLPHEKPKGQAADQEDMHPFDASNETNGEDGEADISSLPGPVQSLLAILYHARNLIHTAPPRTRVELVRLATAVMPKLDSYVRYTRHAVYRIHKVMTLDPAKWVGSRAELAYVSEAACEFLAAAARQSPEYAAQKAVDHFGSVIVELVRKGIPAAIDLLAAVVEAETHEDGAWGGVVTSRWARDVVEAAVPRFVATWAPAMRRYGREDVRPKLEFALKGLVRSVGVGDVVWVTLASARAALDPLVEKAQGNHVVGDVQKWCAEVSPSQSKRWKPILPSSVDLVQVAKLDAILSSP